MNSKIKKHRVSGGFDPRNYKFLESFDNRIVKCDPEDEGEPLEPMPQDLFERLVANDYSYSNCTHCGVRLKSGNLYEHTPTKEVIIIGHTCKKRLAFEGPEHLRNHLLEQDIISRRRLEKFRKSKKWGVVISFLDEHKDKDDILVDLREKLIKYQSLSLKQIKLARSLVRSWEKREKQKAEWEAEAAKAPDWVEGRQKIKCKYISYKNVESGYDYYGSPNVVTKMLVIAEDGRKAWGTMPISLMDSFIAKGDLFEMSATFSVSKKDSKFAFFKRPHIKIPEDKKMYDSDGRLKLKTA